MTKQAKQEREEALTRLREWLEPGDTVYTIVRRVSRSGMSRDIGVVVIRQGEHVEDLHPNWLVSKAIGYPLSKSKDSIKVVGCGMDMGFHLISELAYQLFGDGYKLKQRWL